MSSIIDRAALAAQFPTQEHSPEFWEALGRVVATCGFLEEILAKAIFALTGTRQYTEDCIAEVVEKWVPKLEKALSDPLNPLIDTYGKAARDHSEAKIENFDWLLNELRKLAEIRNALCHGSWRTPDKNGASVPFYISKKKMIFDTSIDCLFLNQVQQEATELICDVMDSVTRMGLQFPGSNGPGKQVK